MSHNIAPLHLEDSDDGDYLLPDRRRQRPTQKKIRPRDTMPELIATQIEGEDEFIPSFTSSHNERRMLQNALSDFYYEHIISDVLAPVKGGKEATVFCCQGHPSTGLNLVAAKIYRPAAFRSLRNDAVYREGREMLDDQGKAIRDARRHRALQKKTRFGRQVAIGSWIEHEYATLVELYGAGADVPKPIGRANTTILMAYLGDVQQPAPALHGVHLDHKQARHLFERLLWNVELMLAHNRVHADLSAFNVLFWEGQATIIDFPQAVLALSNPSAYRFLERDIVRLCQYFSRYGIDANPQDLVADLWSRFMNGEL